MLDTLSFLILLYFSVFSILSVRERRWFWATMPGKLAYPRTTAKRRREWSSSRKQLTRDRV